MAAIRMMGIADPEDAESETASTASRNDVPIDDNGGNDDDEEEVDYDGKDVHLDKAVVSLDDLRKFMSNLSCDKCLKAWDRERTRGGNIGILWL